MGISNKNICKYFILYYNLLVINSARIYMLLFCRNIPFNIKNMRKIKLGISNVFAIIQIFSSFSYFSECLNKTYTYLYLYNKFKME